MRKRLMRYVFATCCLLAGSAQCQAGVVSFGSGANQFNMEFVTIGNPGNAADTTGKPNPAGAVGYTYGIGKFEVRRDMITKFNASQSLQITLGDLSFYGGNGPNKPITGVSWNAAARFVNWLNTSSGGFAAYKFTTAGVDDNIALWDVSDTLDYDASNPYRSKRTTYVLPSYNEWYKAAYYSPSGFYYDYPNGSNTRPTAVTSGTTADTAVYTQLGEASPIGPADVDQAGGLSPYGVMGLGGNVWEWEETSADLANSSGSSFRGFRGCAWVDTLLDPTDLSSSSRYNTIPNYVNYYSGIGFRVASLSPSSPPAVPEPSMMVIGTLFGLGGLVAKRRMKK
ncbi:MAG: SUMF1/EgtB/PvdO family nonheme iron enzyme [Planctomycetaceae bacterium]|jgi:sulfatase modifying factor 1|nr:SUMF1/EgtB/PvdO family nonheme iron enzyme [Planctomycetaceae bacterium]